MNVSFQTYATPDGPTGRINHFLVQVIDEAGKPTGIGREVTIPGTLDGTSIMHAAVLAFGLRALADAIEALRRQRFEAMQ